MPIRDTARSLRDGTLRARDLVEQCLERIDDVAGGDQRLHRDRRRRGAARCRCRRCRTPAGCRSRRPARRADLAEGSARSARPRDDRRIAVDDRRRRRRRAGRGAPARTRRGVRGPHQHARVRAGHDERGLGVRSRAPSPQSAALRRGLEWRIGGRGGDRHEPRLDWLGHRRIDPHPCRRVRPRGPQAGVGRRVAVRGGAAQPDSSTASARSRRAWRTPGTRCRDSG